jgi:hypothetical protein
MSFLDFGPETTLRIFSFCLLIHWTICICMLLTIQQERQDSHNKLVAFLRNIFLPIVQEREAAQNPQGGNNNNPPTPLTVALDHSIRL